MAKPSLSNITMLHDLFIQKYERYLPTAFDESMTLLEKVNKVIERMNEIGEITNELVAKWNEINKWIIEDGLSEEVERNIKNLVKDGTLAELINDELLAGIRQELNAKVENYEFNRQIRRLDERIDDLTTYPTEGITKGEIVEDVLETVNKDLLADLENSVIDGNFKSGDYYKHFKSYFSSATISGTGTAILTSIGSHNSWGGNAIQVLQPNIPTSDKWYIRSKVRSLNTGILDLTVGIKGTSGDSFSGTGERGDVRINHWYELSHLFDPALPPSGENPLTGEFMVSVAGMYPSGSDHEGKSIEIEYIMAINLTSIFGRGQEPDKETMDYIISKIPLSYFEGKLGAGRASSLLLKIAIDRIQDIRDIKSTNIKNAIYNGTFSRNLPSFGWTHDGTARNTENGKFQIIGIGSNNLIQVQQITDLEYRDGDKIYMSAEYTPKNHDVQRVGFAILGTEVAGTQSYEEDVSGLQKKRVSNIFELTGGQGNVRVHFRVRYNTAEESEGKQVDLEKPLVLNLTEIFGKGNEPEKEKIDQLLSYLPDGWFQETANTKNIVESMLKYVVALEKDIEDMDKSDIKNSVYNPRFNKSPFGWQTDGTAWNRENGVFNVIGNGAKNLIRVYQTTDVPVVAGKKVYVQVTMVPRNTDVNQLGIAIYGSETAGTIQYITSTDIELDKEVTLYGVITIPDNAEGNVIFQFRNRYDSAEDGLDKQVDVKNPIMIDLSETFGYGSEPTFERIREFLQTYDGNFFEEYASIKKVDNAHFKMFMINQSSGTSTVPLLTVTIDDSFENDYTVFYPEMKKRGLNATSYIVPDWIENRSGFMTVEQIKEMQDNGWDIQCHSYHHPRLGQLTSEEVEQEFQLVDQWFLEHELGKPEHHAFPYGSTNAEVKKIGMKYRKSLRNIGSYSNLYNPYRGIEWNSLSAKSIDNMTDEEIEQRKAELDQVIKVGGFHIVICHKIVHEIDGDYQTKLSHLLDIIDHWQSRGGQIVTMSEAYNRISLWS